MSKSIKGKILEIFFSRIVLIFFWESYCSDLKRVLITTWFFSSQKRNNTIKLKSKIKNKCTNKPRNSTWNWEMWRWNGLPTAKMDALISRVSFTQFEQRETINCEFEHVQKKYRSWTLKTTCDLEGSIRNTGCNICMHATQIQRYTKEMSKWRSVSKKKGGKRKP